MFINAELSQLPFSEGRRAGRRILNMAAALREEGAVTRPVLVVDISVTGFRAESSDPFEESAEVWLKLPGFEPKRSRVVWVEGKVAGCEFEVPMHESEISALSKREHKVRAKDVFRRF